MGNSSSNCGDDDVSSKIEVPFMIFVAKKKDEGEEEMEKKSIPTGHPDMVYSIQLTTMSQVSQQQNNENDSNNRATTMTPLSPQNDYTIQTTPLLHESGSSLDNDAEYEGGWTRRHTIDGRAYYQNEITKTTQWDEPTECNNLKVKYNNNDRTTTMASVTPQNDDTIQTIPLSHESESSLDNDAENESQWTRRYTIDDDIDDGMNEEDIEDDIVDNNNNVDMDESNDDDIDVEYNWIEFTEYNWIFMMIVMMMMILMLI